MKTENSVFNAEVLIEHLYRSIFEAALRNRNIKPLTGFLFLIRIRIDMAIPQKVIKYLDSANIKYELVEHRTVYTAYDKAETLDIPQKSVGKTLVMKMDKGLALVLLPANKNLDKNKFKKLSGAKKVNFASETVIKNRLKGIKLGAVPPFGALWKIPTFIDRALLKAPKVIINAGDYRCSIKVSGASLKKITPDLVSGSFTKAR